MSKNYSMEEKHSFVQRYLKGETVKDLIVKFGISKSTAYSWITKFDIQYPEGIKHITGREIFELQRKIKRLEETIEVLKTVDCNVHYPLRNKL